MFVFFFVFGDGGRARVLLGSRSRRGELLTGEQPVWGAVSSGREEGQAPVQEELGPAGKSGTFAVGHRYSRWAQVPLGELIL